MHRLPGTLLLAFSAFALVSAVAPHPAPVPAPVLAPVPKPQARQEPSERPRILITNDNGIDDPKLIALARAFATRAETWVVAPAEDQSGTGTSLKLPRAGAVAVERRDLGAGIEAFAVEGYPGDCVVVALLGILRDRPPSLVVSGINGGPNLGGDWMFSGTVGAARIAALAGLPALAVSGLDDDVPGAVEAAVDWVVRFAEHSIVKDLEPGDYLTVSLPPGGPTDVQGVRAADRAPLRRGPSLGFDESAGVWRITGLQALELPLSAISDERLHEGGMVVVVPMRADEVDRDRLVQWTRNAPAFPRWSRPD